MVIQQWTIGQWRLVYEMVTSNKWSLPRYVDKDQEGQIDVWLIIAGSWDVVVEYEHAFGGRRRRTMRYKIKGEGEEFTWALLGSELDDFLDNLWTMLSKEDPHNRLTDVRQAQDIRRRVREGCSYPFYHPKAPKRY